MELLVILLLVAAFVVWPSYGVYQRQITLKGVTIYLDKTPITFWCSVGYLYICGIAFPCIMWQVPYAGIFLPLMGVFLIMYLLVYFLKW